MRRGVHHLVNWGNGNDIQRIFGDNGPTRIYNRPSIVAIAANKLATFNALKDKDGINIPTFTHDRSVAAQWITDGATVVCRTKLSGHSGDGIVLANKSGDLVDAPLYVQYIKKQQEFRVHICFGEVIDVQEKRQRKDYDGQTDFQVRNHHTGWVYCREDIREPVRLRELGVRTVQELGLDFGAVDIIYNAKRDVCYVLEVNTAPGLEGTTVEKYAESFVRNLK